MNTESMVTKISTLGEAKIATPVQKRADDCSIIRFVTDDDRVVIEIDDRPRGPARAAGGRQEQRQDNVNS